MAKDKKKLKTVQKNVEEVIEAIETEPLDPEEQRRNDELFRFIDDFIASEEYQMYLEKKRNIVKRDAEIQCSSQIMQTDFEELERKERQTLYPLTKASKKIFIFQKQFQEYLKNKECEKTVVGQEYAIEVIRNKICEARALFLCHRNERAQERILNREKVITRFCKKFNVNLSTVKRNLEYAKNIIFEKHRNSKIGKRQMAENRRIILEKLVFERERDQQIEKMLTKTYDYKVIKREKIMDDMEIVGTQMTLWSQEVPAEEIEEVRDDDFITETEGTEKTDKSKKRKKDKKDKKKKKKKSDKKSSKSSKKSKGSKGSKKGNKKGSKKGKKGKKEKKKKSKTEEEWPFVLPNIPVVNTRKKIKQSDIAKMKDLLSVFEFFDEVLENRNMLHTLYDDCWNYEVDNGFVCNYTVVSIKGYLKDKMYRRKLKILNRTTVARKLRFWKTEFPEPFDRMFFEIEPVSIKKMYPGYSFIINIKFEAPEYKLINGYLVFLSYDTSTFKYYQYKVPLECVPASTILEVMPNKIFFGNIPIWEAKKMERKTFRSLKIQNVGNRMCKIVISSLRKKGWFDDESQPIEHGIETVLEEITEEAVQIDDEKSVKNTESEKISKSLIKEVVSYVRDNFELSTRFIILEALSGAKIKVYFKNIEYIGFYFDKFIIDVYEMTDDGEDVLVACKELYFSVEITGPLVTVNPEQLSFGVCNLNTSYQLSFEVENLLNTTVSLSVKFPSVLRDHLTASTMNTVLQAKEKRKLLIRFIPRIDILMNYSQYFDPDTSILEFPIYIDVNSNNTSNVPVLKLYTYAIVTDPKSVFLKPPDTTLINERIYSDVIDLGECSIYETVHQDLEIVSYCHSPMHYYFPNLPESIEIHPNYGFGYILPFERKILRVNFSPSARDIPQCMSEAETFHSKVSIMLTLETVEHTAGSKKTLNYKKLRRSFELMVQELDNRSLPKIFNDMKMCALALRQDIASMNNMLETTTGGGSRGFSSLFIRDEETDNGTYNEDSFTSPICVEESLLVQISDATQETLKLYKQMWVSAVIIRPLCDFSHQFVKFPLTPCGSYSVMSIFLRALKGPDDQPCVCGYISRHCNNPDHVGYEVEYKIVGDNPEIQVEPACGLLKSGTKIKLTLVACPQIPDDFITKKAELIRYFEIFERKMQEAELKRQKDYEKALAKQMEKGKNKDKKGKKGKKDKSSSKSSKKGKKDKKGKGGKDKKSKKAGKKGKKDKSDTEKEPKEIQMPPLPEITVNQEEIIIDYFDRYPAEMCLWEEFEPYLIEATFTCFLKYRSDNVSRKTDVLYLNAVCEVVHPDFTHNLNVQHLNFGPVLIGSASRKVICLKNINNEKLTPRVTHLLPNGPFVNPHCNISVEPEFGLKIPISYKPFDTAEVKEYFELTAGRTICPLIVSGVGVEPNILINPALSVFRIQAPENFYTDCSIEIHNKSEAPADIVFEKVFELIGNIKELVKPKVDKSKAKDKKQKGKKGKGKGSKKSKSSKKTKSSKSKKSKGSKKKKEKKSAKASNELTEEEVVSIENYFLLNQGESYFTNVIGKDNTNCLYVEPLAKKLMKIRFGTPEAIMESLKEILEEKKSKKDKKGKKGSKKNKTSKGSKSSKKSKGSKKSKSSKGKKKKINPEDEIYYLTKFNILLGCTFLKDIIILAKFE